MHGVYCDIPTGHKTSDSNRDEVFIKIFNENSWGDPETKSGSGSSLQATGKLRKNFEEFLKSENIKSIMDLGCGDFNWMSRILLPSGVSYVGVDIVPDLIKSNKKYTTSSGSGSGGNSGSSSSSTLSSTKFFVSDIVETPPYKKFDVILLRDVLTHLNQNDILQVLRNIKSSGSKYLLTTIYSKNCLFLLFIIIVFIILFLL
eukprot:TRINITY_DN1956_c1_g1_i1.p1 TRINITY_DN1956_c1_g1~~TRINITY_DN1956_c1_g1_i1.p1  ORF type:complete len:202 (+),score=25.33 TRINITY_DN1956_c1_g1_i1:294-899(+)